MKNKIMLAAAIGCAALNFTACGDEVTEQIVQSNSGLESVAAIDELPECTSENAGAMAFVSDSAKVYYCVDSSWQLLNGKDGIDGVDGKPGQNGTDGESCTVEKLKDKDGYKVVCGGDSIGVVLNGANGTNGADGANGADGKPGEDGSDGANGSAGAGCTAEALADNSGYKIICGGEIVGTLLNGQNGKPGEKGDTGETGAKGEDGKDGADCILIQKTESFITLQCGENSFDLYRPICGGEIFDPTSQFCSNEKIYDFCAGENFNPADKFCYENQEYPLCGTSEFNPSNQFCQNDAVYDFCGGAAYDVEAFFCFDDGTVELCGNEKFNPTEQFCGSDNAIYEKCGVEGPYDVATKFCYENEVYEKCNNAVFDPTEKFCANNKLYDLCGGAAYNPSSEICINDAVIQVSKPNWEYMNPDIDYELFKDERDGQYYRTVQIGEQVWMAENLNYKLSSGNNYCYNDDRNYCLKYGRLYTRASVSCPNGWHLPNILEFLFWPKLRFRGTS